MRFEILHRHLYYGEESGAALQERIEEIGRVAEYFGKRSEEAEKEFRSLILLGDFNIVHPEHETMAALTAQGLKIPKGLEPSNVAGGKYYDQIAFKARSGVLEYVDAAAENKSGSGVFNIFKDLFTPAEFEHYKDDVAKSPNGRNKNGDEELKRYYSREWHLPVKRSQADVGSPLYQRQSQDEQTSPLQIPGRARTDLLSRSPGSQSLVALTS